MDSRRRGERTYGRTHGAESRVDAGTNGDDQVNIAIAQSLAGDLEGAAASLRRALNVGYRISDLRGIKALEPVLSSVVDQEGDTE